MIFAVRSTIDVALWFHDKAEAAGIRMPAQKLQRLLLLAQARYRPVGLEIALMPAVFVPSSMGPVEPNIYALFESGVPSVNRLPLAESTSAHLQSIWQVFGSLQADELNQAVNADLACMRLVAANDSPVPKRPPEGPRAMTTESAPNNSAAGHRKELKVTEPVVIKGNASKSGKQSEKIGSALDDLVQSLRQKQATKPKSAIIEKSKGGASIRKWRPKRRVK